MHTCNLLLQLLQLPNYLKRQHLTSQCMSDYRPVQQHNCTLDSMQSKNSVAENIDLSCTAIHLLFWVYPETYDKRLVIAKNCTTFYALKKASKEWH